VTAWPRALAASALVTTEQESKLPAAAELDGEGEGLDGEGEGLEVVEAEEEDAAVLVAGALDGVAGADEDDEAQAASEIAAQLAMTKIANDCRRILSSPLPAV
jgi:hypothetical protein